MAAYLAEVKATLAAKNSNVVAQIARIQDRVDTLDYGIDAGDATERAELLVKLKAWKDYKYALGKLTKQVTWPVSTMWPPEPAVPEIEAAPLLVATKTI